LCPQFIITKKSNWWNIWFPSQNYKASF
jgi:hypothetical protein